jgi:hypothetical protein
MMIRVDRFRSIRRDEVESESINDEDNGASMCLFWTTLSIVRGVVLGKVGES